MTRAPRKNWMAELVPSDPSPGARRGVRAGSGRLEGTQPGQKAITSFSEGVGLTSARLRLRMVERLRASGIREERVLAAMAHVPRHAFVDEALASRAYEDSALPIGLEQTISQPFIVARMTEALCACAQGGKVLEIGTGCGYQAAILAAIAGEVYSVERIRVLHDRARQNLRPLRLPNLRLVYGDGLKGLPEAAPFDGMLIAAAAADLPETLLLQLRLGGVAIAPLGADHQSLCRISRTGPRSFARERLEDVRFVPLLPGTT